MMNKLLLIFIASASSAAILYVPADYATIQSALNATAPFDTVLVREGVYAEALFGSSHPFVLMGEVGQDSGDVPLPIIDPSPLPNSRWAACLTIGTLSGTVIENIAFRNGPQMFPRQQGTPGGLNNATAGLIVRNCLFDSVYIGVKGTAHTILENCRFEQGVYACIDLDLAQLTARNCWISGTCGGWGLIEAGSGSLLENCIITDNGLGQAVYFVLASNVIIRGCIFQNITRRVYSYLVVRGNSNLIENCIFRDNEMTNALLGLTCSCDSPTVVRGCTFEGNYTPRDWTFSVGKGIAFIYFDGGSPDCPGILLEDNVFRDGQIENGMLAVQAQGPALFRRNRVTEMGVPIRPAIEVVDGDADFRDNLFFDNPFIMSSDLDAYADASYNWWGDSTGPFQPVSNPEGRGDSVGNNVSFFPWYTDTLFLINDANIPSALPTNYSLSIYPNPFNNTANIVFDLPREVTGRLVVYDVLGRVANTLHDGRLSAGTHSMQFDGSNLSSGIYFVKLETPELNAVQKAVLVK